MKPTLIKICNKLKLSGKQEKAGVAILISGKKKEYL
jgi:hypothetical protein